MITEPVVTWNLYFTPAVVALSTGIILFFIKRMFSKRDAQDVRIAALLAEKEETKDESLDEWRERFDKKLCEIRDEVKGIAKEVTARVTWDHCSDRKREIDQRIREVERR